MKVVEGFENMIEKMIPQRIESFPELSGKGSAELEYLRYVKIPPSNIEKKVS